MEPFVACQLTVHIPLPMLYVGDELEGCKQALNDMLLK